MPIHLRFNRTKLNLWLDLVLVIAFACELEFHFTGLRLHELLGVTFGVALVLHLLLHWDWIWNVTKTFFRNLWQESRLNYVLNIVLFVDGLLMVLSGVLISQTLGLSFTVNEHATAFAGLSWQRVHVLSAELSLIIVALHVALHWKWIATHAAKYMLTPLQKITTLFPRSAQRQEVQHGA